MLFGLFINDLAHHINKLDVGLPCEVFLLAMLMFAGDIALIAENECKLQCLLDVLHEWCNKWEMQINQYIFIKRRKPRSLYSFSCGPHSLTYTEMYKYLGSWLNEHLDFSQSLDHVVISAKKAFGTQVQNVWRVHI